MSTPLRAVTRALAALLTGVLLSACTGGSPNDAERPPDPALVAATSFLDAWAELDAPGAAALTDDPAAATVLLSEAVDTLSVTAASFTPGGVVRTSDSADFGDSVQVPYRARLTLATLGDWEYDGSLDVGPGGSASAPAPSAPGGWVVRASPTMIHPQLTPTTRLARSRSLPPRAPILDALDRPLMQERPVVDIGLEPRAVTDLEGALSTAAQLLDIDADALRGRVAAAAPDAFVPVIVLRQESAAEVTETLRTVPGFVLRPRTATLAPTASFGRAVLGTVRAATAETLPESGPLASAVDDVGSSGLQQEFQVQLAGTPSGEVRIVAREGVSVVATLFTFPGAPGEPLRTTLDLDVQAAAEAALGTVTRAGALVALRPSTGEVLAAASTPADGQDRALAGQYPPGSTFKVVTTAALLAGGLSADSVVGCPAEVVVDGKRFVNFEGFALGEVPFRTDFARSCNTAFVGLAGGLGAGELAATAASFGLGRDWSLGVPAFSGSVPDVPGAVDRAAAAIGQGKVLASPLSMATVAAAVASGTPRAPSLLRGAPAGSAAPAEVLPPLDAGVSAGLRELMRAVVTDGSAEALDLPGEPIAAKTGTAEFGSDDPPRTHAWTIGYRGDLAFAVLLEDGGSGGRDAAPVARAFLDSLL